MSLFRRAGAELLKVIERVLDPAAEANRIYVYSKDVAGITHLFARASDGTIYQLTPSLYGINILDENVAIPGNPHQALNFIGAGVQAVDAGGGQSNVFVPGGAVADGSMLIWGVDNVGSASDTRFIPPGRANGLATTSSVYQFAMARAGTLRNLYVRHNSAGGNGNNVVYTVMVNGVATLITATKATGAIGTVSDLVNGFAAAQGDLVAIRATKAVAVGGGNIDVQVSLELD
jgi:hypothetical protein